MSRKKRMERKAYFVGILLSLMALLALAAGGAGDYKKGLRR